MYKLLTGMCMSVHVQTTLTLNTHNYIYTVPELEITAGHWPFSKQTVDLTEHFTKCSAIVAYQATCISLH